MATKGERTRHSIVSAAATTFNTKGFAGTSMADILAATGLEKGGLYRHFPSKDELALAAFDYAMQVVAARHASAQGAAETPFARVLACIDVVADSVRRPPVRGGCPILNTATEADDTHAALRARAAAAMRDWQARVAALIAEAIDAGEVCADVEPRAAAAILISALEGAIMTTNLLRDHGQMTAVASHLRTWLDGLRTQPTATVR